MKKKDLKRAASNEIADCDTKSLCLSFGKSLRHSHSPNILRVLTSNHLQSHQVSGRGEMIHLIFFIADFKTFWSHQVSGIR